MSYRKFNINGQTWSYKVGRNNVHLRDPDGKGQVIVFSALVGYRSLSLERHRERVQEIVNEIGNKPGSLKAIMDKIGASFALIEEENTIRPSDIKHWIECRRTTESIYLNNR